MKVASLFASLWLSVVPCSGQIKVECQGLSLKASPPFDANVLSGGETVHRLNGDSIYVLDNKIVQINADKVTINSFELRCGQAKGEATSVVGEPDQIYSEAMLGDYPIQHTFYAEYGLAIDFWGGYVSRIRLLDQERWQRRCIDGQSYLKEERLP